jgi:ATP-binding cassette subfamily C protein
VVTQVLSLLTADLGTLAILGLGSLLVIDQQLSIGQLIAFNKMNLNLVLFTSRGVMFTYELIRVQAIMQRLAEVLEATPETDQDGAKPWVSLSAQGDMVCTNLSFHYPGRQEVLQNLAMTIPGGQVTAIVGASGCGKSTLAKLLASLYRPQGGQLRLGNFNQGDLALECWRQQVVLVPQEAHFWTRTILQNFRLSHPQASFEAIVAACQITGADAFISQLPDQYHTVLGEFGANLSGGQKQRLALARALVSDPPVLILDESTGALDPASETAVLAALLDHRRGKTTILISHRPPVVNRADWVIVVEAGQVVMTGSPAQLKTIPGHHQEFLGG